MLYKLTDHIDNMIKTDSKALTLFHKACLLIILQSCCFSTKNTSLGDNYKLSEYSVKEVEIMYCFDSCCNSGLSVIPQTVIAYNYNKDWIIAKSDSRYNNNTRDFAYWIFKKDVDSSQERTLDHIKANLTGPVDWETFNKVLSEKGIDLELITYLK